MKIIVHIVNQKNRADHDIELEVSDGFRSMMTALQSREVSQILGHKNWNALTYRKDGASPGFPMPGPMAPRPLLPHHKPERVWHAGIPKGSVRFSSHLALRQPI